MFSKITPKTYSKSEFDSVSLVNKSVLSEIVFKRIIFQVFFHKTLQVILQYYNCFFRFLKVFFKIFQKHFLH